MLQSTGLRLAGLRRLPRRRRLSTSSSASTTPTLTGLWLKGIHRLPHRRRLWLSFHQYVLRRTQCTPSGPSSQSPNKKGYGGIGMSGVTLKHEVLPGDRDRRGRAHSSSFDSVLKEEQERKDECIEAPKARPKQTEEKH
jgi:hypothetical protein